MVSENNGFLNECNMDFTKADKQYEVVKGWGKEIWFRNSPQFCTKGLFIDKGKKLSVHFHKLKSEIFWVANNSSVEVIIYDDPDLDQFVESWDNLYAGLPNAPPWLKTETYILEQYDSLFIPVGRRHTVRAFQDALIVEGSTEHFDNDSFRVLKGD